MACGNETPNTSLDSHPGKKRGKMGPTIDYENIREIIEGSYYRLLCVKENVLKRTRKTIRVGDKDAEQLEKANTTLYPSKSYLSRHADAF